MCGKSLTNVQTLNFFHMTKVEEMLFQSDQNILYACYYYLGLTTLYATRFDATEIIVNSLKALRACDADKQPKIMKTRGAKLNWIYRASSFTIQELNCSWGFI